ncbi:pyridoxamine 5'-phosphate oxidase family protein [Roseivivax sp. CAU 1761]
MSDDLKTAFWKRLDDVQAGLLAPAGDHPIPMAPNAEADENAIWFITAAGSAAHRGAQSGGEARFDVADAKANLYATVAGRLAEVNDSKKLDECWSRFAAAWFEDGRDDEKVRLVKFTPHSAEVWAPVNGAAYLYEIAKANMSKHTPEAGEHGRVAF